MAEIVTPDWVKDAIFYQIFPDRFARSPTVTKPSNLEPWDSLPTRHGFKGGDLPGVVEHLEYLLDLGITAIYFNPVFQSTANHRYHTYDYYHVDPILGGDAALRTLLEEAHRQGIRVILDGVFNHASRGFFQFNHVLENGPASPYLDWFTIKGFPLYAYDTSRKPNYAAWWGLHALPKLNTDNPAVREFLWGVGQYWIEQGIDGWRLDVAGEIDDDEFWREFRRQVKAANPEAYIVGEIWHDARRWLQGDQFDAVMNYLFTKVCIGFFIGEAANPELIAGVGYWPVPPLSAEKFAEAIDQLLGLYPTAVTQVQFNVLDTHDTARFLTIARGDESALRLATLFQMTYPGAPCIYYGDEIGLPGTRDPDSRRAMPWDESRWNHELRAFFKRCIALRKAHPALCYGDFTRLHAENMVYVFGRRLGEETLIVALNAGLRPATIEVPVAGYVPDGANVQQAWTGEALQVASGKLRGLKLAPRSGAVYVWQT
jgi:cyclomaltodextrinase